MFSLGKLFQAWLSAKFARENSRPQGLSRVHAHTMLALAMLGLSMFSLATLASGQERSAKPTAEERENWRQKIVRTRRPKRGCFIATYPETEWHEVKCLKPPRIPYPPKKGLRPETVGNGTDFSADVTGTISLAEGLFDSVGGVMNETGSNGVANSFSLQLNTEHTDMEGNNTLPTSACSGHSGCSGWQQFIYTNSNCENPGLYPQLNSKACVFIQYWLLNYGSTCPSSSWNASGVNCYINSTNATPVPTPPGPTPTIADLSDMKLSGIPPLSGADDAVTLTLETTNPPVAYTAVGDSTIPDLAQNWKIAEFNIFGDGGGQSADFNTGSTLVVHTSVESSNSGTDVPPSCDGEGYTGELNNLTLVEMTPPVIHNGLPSLIFKESNASGSTQVTCTGAITVGDTHITSFDGLYYMFQASGDFVLVDDGDFVVHTRQASAAPTWPGAAVNKAIAVKMGNTRLNFYVEPQQHILIDGRPAAIANGKTEGLAGGVQIARHGDTYKVSNDRGDMVKVTLNDPAGAYTKWIDVSVGLGLVPRPNVRGLLGNPKGNAHELTTAEGRVLREPVAFNDLYKVYGDSWRVKAGDSLFAEATTIQAGNPEKPFFPEHLDPQVAARARATCAAAGVTGGDYLDACILDNAVLGHEAAAKVFVHAVPPKHVIKPEPVKPEAR